MSMQWTETTKKEWRLPGSEETKYVDTMEDNIFEFYLDAWFYCKRNRIPFEKIKRKTFKLWKIEA